MTPEESRRVSKMTSLLIGHLKNDTPEIGATAMAHLLAFSTTCNREGWLEEMGSLFDLAQKEKAERAK